MFNEYDVLVKTIMIGDAGVGKTAFCKKLANSEFSDIYNSTIGVDFFIKYLEINNKVFKLQLWDTAGQERFESIVNSYFKNAKFVILMLDLNGYDNNIKIVKWYNKIIKYCLDGVKILVVGNKTDLKNNTDMEFINNFLSEHNLPYLEMSVKTCKNFNSFENAILDIMYDIPSNYYKFDIIELKSPKRKLGCC